MSNQARWRWCAVLATLLLWTGTPVLEAQVQSGSLFAEIRSAEGGTLPGVTVTLSGQGAPQVQQSNELGQVRFLGLSPGEYEIKAELDGYAAVKVPSVKVSVNRNTTLELRLSAIDPSTQADFSGTIMVVSEAPLLDPRKINTGISVGQTELESIPSARDPWVILQQAPGVLVDRINVGGNESGQQSTYISPGTNSNNSAWSVDGVTITDMGAIGSSPSYYNFDSFEEMQVTTGGSDAALATGGVTMNMVTKRGTNEWRFSSRYMVTDESAQSDLEFSQSELAQSGPWNGSNPQTGFEQGNRIVDVKDFGIEGGGPLVQDRAWLWASYGEQETDLLTIDDVSDFTDLESYAAKLNLQLGTNNSAVGFYHYGNKIKIGRNASPIRPQATTWDQDGPTDIYKLEDTHIFGNNFYLTGMASHVGGGFSLSPQGGGLGDLSAPNVTRRPDNVWQNSFLEYSTDRPQDQAKLDGNLFAVTGPASHELRFGVGYRTVTVDSYSNWPGQQLVGRGDVALGGPDTYLGLSFTEAVSSADVDYTEAFVQDTITLGGFTANLGLRYDLQQGSNNATLTRPAPIDADGILVGGAFAGSDAGFEWESITPRLGLTWALGEERATLVRASYAQFADQLSSGLVTQASPAGAQVGFFVWNDNGDLQITDDEVGPFFAFNNVDPSRPGELVVVNAVDSGLDAPTTDELVLAVEHALRPEFVIGLSLTGRRYTDIVEFENLVLDSSTPAGSIGRPHTGDDYEQTTVLEGVLPNGSPFSVPFYSLREGLVSNGGTLLRNGDRAQDYLGASLTFNKRLANRWLLRGHVTWSDWTWDVPQGTREDPTDQLPGNFTDGGAVLIGGGNTSGPKGNVFINSNWSYDLSGMVQISPDRPWGFNLAANVNGREGYPLPYNVVFDPQDTLGARNVLVTGDVEDFRTDDVHIVNARVEKELLFGDFGLTLSLDGFNLFNESLVLQRETSIAASQGGLAIGNASGDFVREIVSPRVFRVGARLSFR